MSTCHSVSAEVRGQLARVSALLPAHMIPETELRWLGSVASAYTCGAILSTQLLFLSLFPFRTQTIILIFTSMWMEIEREREERVCKNNAHLRGLFRGMVYLWLGTSRQSTNGGFYSDFCPVLCSYTVFRKRKSSDRCFHISVNWSCEVKGNSSVFHQPFHNGSSGYRWCLNKALGSWSTALPLCTELTTMS